MNHKALKAHPEYANFVALWESDLPFPQKQATAHRMVKLMANGTLTEQEARDAVHRLLLEEGFFFKLRNFFTQQLAKLKDKALSVLKSQDIMALPNKVQKELPEIGRKVNEKMQKEGVVYTPPTKYEVQQFIIMGTQQLGAISPDIISSVGSKLAPKDIKEHMADDQWNISVFIHKWIMLYVIYSLIAVGTFLAPLGGLHFYVFLIPVAAELADNLVSKKLTPV